MGSNGIVASTSTEAARQILSTRQPTTRGLTRTSTASQASPTGKRGGHQPRSYGAAPITARAASSHPSGATKVAAHFRLHIHSLIAAAMDERAVGYLNGRSSAA
mmetsp:Transcript_30916/g.60713  ORF Transcript_30916/g.60713 Transcript_30916/m.60713 type:complete len:104 (+) Transcript_30916:652-963(+)